MSIGDWIVTLGLGAIVFCILWGALHQKKTSCSGDCAHCSHHVDWMQIRKEIHTEDGCAKSVASTRADPGKKAVRSS